jgi:hypothetical protein
VVSSRKKTWPTELRNWGLTKMASRTLRHAKMATISFRHANSQHTTLKSQWQLFLFDLRHANRLLSVSSVALDEGVVLDDVFRCTESSAKVQPSGAARGAGAASSGSAAGSVARDIQ